MLLNRIHNYPNHFLQDGRIFRGERQRVEVKPDNEGYCNIRYKGETSKLKYNDIIGLKNSEPKEEIQVITNNNDYDIYSIILSVLAGVPEKDIMKKYDVSRSTIFRARQRIDLFSSFEDLCSRLGFSSASFRSFLREKFNIKTSELKSEEDKYSKLLQYIEHRNIGPYKSRVALCEHLGAVYATYKLYMLKKGIKVTELSVRNNEPYIKEFLKQKREYKKTKI